jgi:hypothetical protein
MKSTKTPAEKTKATAAPKEKPKGTPAADAVSAKDAKKVKITKK